MNDIDPNGTFSVIETVALASILGILFTSQIASGTPPTSLTFPPLKLRLSAQGEKFIKYEEERGKVALVPYEDSRGYCTIGWGHLVQYPPRGCDGSEQPIDIGEADRLFRIDIQRFTIAIWKSVRAPLTQSQFDALMSYVYNNGENSLYNTRLLKKLNASDYNGAASEFTIGWEDDSELFPRRQREQRLFRSGVSYWAGKPDV